MSKIVYVNSTLGARKKLSLGEQPSLFHYWGFISERGDKFYSHSSTRFEVVLRHRIGGLDLPILRQVIRDFSRGYKSLYLVTQPDLLSALPFLKKLFPHVKIVTWVWMADEAVRHARSYRCCDHLFCLTQDAQDQLVKMGLADKCSLQILGADPNFYAEGAEPEIEYDACVVGLTDRDFQVVQQAMSSRDMRVATTQSVIHSAKGRARSEDFIVTDAQSNRDVITMLRRSKVSWIPLLPGKSHPAGYTNLVESLLCGVPVVIADSSTIPEELLSLPGVWRYRAGDVNSFVENTRLAMEAGVRPDFREKVRSAAAPVFDIKRFASAVRQHLQS